MIYSFLIIDLYFLIQNVAEAEEEEEEVEESEEEESEDDGEEKVVYTYLFGSMCSCA